MEMFSVVAFKKIFLKQFLIELHNNKNHRIGTSLVAQCMGLRAPNAGGLGLIPGQGTRSHMHATTKSSHVTTKEPVRHN